MSPHEHDSQNLRWFALQVRPRFEGLVSANLRGKGYEEFLPVYSSTRRWSDRLKESILPLFPGYLFCRLDLGKRRLPVLTTPGVISLVGVGKMPVPLSDEEIAALRTVMASSLPARPWPSVSVGTRVFIERGPLAGFEGIALSVDKKYRLVLSVPLLQRSIAVEIDREWARPVADEPKNLTAAASAA